MAQDLASCVFPFPSVLRVFLLHAGSHGACERISSAFTSMKREDMT